MDRRISSCILIILTSNARLKAMLWITSVQLFAAGNKDNPWNKSLYEVIEKVGSAKFLTSA